MKDFLVYGNKPLVNWYVFFLALYISEFLSRRLLYKFLKRNLWEFFVTQMDQSSVPSSESVDSDIDVDSFDSENRFLILSHYLPSVFVTHVNLLGLRPVPLLGRGRLAKLSETRTRTRSCWKLETKMSLISILRLSPRLKKKKEKVLWVSASFLQQS